MNRRCYWKDCSGEVVGALAHTYMPEGLLWYCADHAPNSDHFRDQTMIDLRRLMERIARSLEEIALMVRASRQEQVRQAL